jgi:NADH-quinone oxidoreductase subunit M
LDFEFPILSLITFLPLLGALGILFVKAEKEALIKWLALSVAVANFLLSLPLFFYFQPQTAEMQFVENVPWIPSLGVSYHLGVDGISLLLVLLTTLLSAVAILSSWTAITDRVKEYYVFMLLLEMGMIGVFVSLDLLLFYVFWEITLIPMYFLISMWGGKRRIYAALKFVFYTMAGSVLMLVAIMALYFMNAAATGEKTFDLLRLYQLQAPVGRQVWLFLAFALAFAIKVPLFPFHTWLPDAHVEAPTAGSVILAGVLLKMGAYGLARFCLPLFPEAAATFTPLMSVLALIGIIYGALVALSQRDVKSLVAYSSVSHLGFVVLGIFAMNAQGLSGGILQMVNHGLSTGGLFLLVGMLYERRHTRLLEDFGGLWKQLPIFGLFLLIVTLSSIGLPGLNGFVGEFTILVGTFKAQPIYAVFAALGIILGAWYMLTMFRRVMHGPLDKPANRELQDLSTREIAVLVPIVILIFLIGIFPNLFLAKMGTSVAALLAQVAGP